MTGSAPAPVAPGEDVVVAAVRLLALRGEQARVDVLRVAVDAIPSLRSLVLRAAPAGVVVAAADAVRSTPEPQESQVHAVDHWTLDLPLRRERHANAVLTADSVEPLTPQDAATLRAVADALALVAPAAPSPDAAAAQALLDEEADLAMVAAELDETVAEALVALRHTDPAKVGEAAAAALADVRRIAGDLRAKALYDGLRAALAELRERGAQVHAEDPALDAAPPAVAVLVQRVAEGACRAAVGIPRIVALSDEDTVKLWVESADNAVDASEVERWRRRAAALQGELRSWAGGVELSLPATSGDEGRHDDGPDLRRPPHGP